MTRQDLILAVLENLNAIGVGRRRRLPDDISTVDKRVDSELSQLARRGILYVPDPEEFDDELRGPLAVIIANACAPSYGQARNPASVLEAENLLREMQAGDGAGRGPVKAQYY